MSQKSDNLPAPVQGLVVTFNYLWVADSARGDIEARKARPCIIIAVAAPPSTVAGVIKIVGFIPITHSAPVDSALYLSVPEQHKHQMGLDREPCWVVFSEMNTSIWPGYDLIRTTKAVDGWTRGHVPGIFLDKILSTIRGAIEASSFKNTPRR